MDLREQRCDAGDRIEFGQDREQWRVYARAVMNI